MTERQIKVYECVRSVFDVHLELLKDLAKLSDNDHTEIHDRAGKTHKKVLLALKIVLEESN